MSRIFRVIANDYWLCVDNFEEDPTTPDIILCDFLVGGVEGLVLGDLAPFGEDEGFEEARAEALDGPSPEAFLTLGFLVLAMVVVWRTKIEETRERESVNE